VNLWQVSSIGGATMDTRLRATTFEDRTLSSTWLFQDNSFVSAGVSFNNEVPWLLFPSLSKIKVNVIPSAAAGTNRIDADFSVLLIRN
jgi:hypothetical protein